MASLIFIAVLSFFVTFVFYRRTSIAVWGYIGAFLPDLPTLVLAPLGATGLYTVQLLSHTIGVIFWPVILLIIDVFLIEFSLLRIARPFGSLLPGSFRMAIKIEKLVERFQDYYAIPRPERLKAVYMSGVTAGIINLFVGLVIGSL